MRIGGRGGGIPGIMAGTTVRTCKLYSGASGDISLTGVEGSEKRSNERLGCKGWGQLMKESMEGREGSKSFWRPYYTPVPGASQSFSHSVLPKGPQGGTT